MNENSLKEFPEARIYLWYVTAFKIVSGDLEHPELITIPERIAATRLLWLCGAEAIKTLAKVLKEEDTAKGSLFDGRNSIHFAAVTSLSKTGSEEAIPVLLEFYSTNLKRELRKIIISAIEELGFSTKPVIDFLMKILLDEPVTDCNMWAVSALLGLDLGGAKGKGYFDSVKALSEKSLNYPNAQDSFKADLEEILKKISA